MTWGWAACKMQNSRIALVTKEVKWELENTDKKSVAYILAMASLLRLEFQKELGEAPFLNPSAVPEKLLRNLYDTFEDNVNLSNNQAKAHQQGIFGLPEIVKRQVKVTNVALKIWMATMGYSLRPKGRYDVEIIWNHLNSAISELPSAIDRLKQMEGEGLFGGGFIPDELPQAAVAQPRLIR